ncbi:MAG: hypothetical protein JXR83_22520 [Deltaproteobacteria bacterium]|nr:hypothetical protein [Deltaproteobacteria bacterium]
MHAVTRSRPLRWCGIAALALLAPLAVACIDFYDQIRCDNEDQCPHGYMCNVLCMGPGESCDTDADCDQYEAVKNHRELLCVGMPWESKEDFLCRLSCTPGSTSNETGCPPGQQCRSLADGTDLGTCF